MLIPNFTTNKNLNLFISISAVALLCYYLGVFDGKVTSNRLRRKAEAENRGYWQEHQLDRHADYLDRLEDRIAALEKKKEIGNE